MKYYILSCILLLCFTCNAQNFFIDDWFAKKCNHCKEITSDVILSDNVENAWHNAHISFTKNNYDKASYYLLKDGTSKKEIKDLLHGQIMLGLDLHEKAENFFNQKTLLNNPDYSLIATKSLGDLKLLQKEYDLALKYYNEVLLQKIPDKVRDEIFENLGFIYLVKKKYKKSEQYFLKLKSNYKKSNDSLSLARVYSSLGNLFFEQYQDQKAKQYFDTAYVQSKLIKSLKLKRDVSYNLYIVSEALQSHKDAISYLKEYNVFKDSIHTEKTIWEVAQHKEAFNIAKKQAEIDKKTAQRNMFFLVTIIVLFVSVVIYYLYNRLQIQYQKIRELNKELKESNNVKNQIFSIVAHDLRSPVALLKQKLRLAPKTTDNTSVTLDKNVITIIDSLHFLLDNLLNWSLSQSNLLQVQKDWFPLLPVIQQIHYQYTSLVDQKKIELTIHDIDNVLLYGDMELFKVVVRNCLDNAIKFTPQGGKISFSGAIEGDFFKLKIKDSGTGIPETVLKTLFELHAKKAQQDTSGRKSSGLGLHIVKSMIELNDGLIHINNHPSGGAIVNISIPYKIIA